MNGKVLKGIVFVLLEVIINIQAHFNSIIILSFHGEIEKAIQLADYQWLMFYPCLYFYAMWDAWRESGEKIGKGSFYPFVFAGYFVTLGCIYSSSFRLFGVLLGPVWLPILSVIPGIFIGKILQKVTKRKQDMMEG